MYHMLCLNWEVDFSLSMLGYCFINVRNRPIAFKLFNHKSGLILLWTFMLAVSLKVLQNFDFPNLSFIESEALLMTQK